ncbi:hypothetical protein CMO85_00485 [Candidatus Woesearchaeota archaeon]|nr:hypothetical protein [Candidatus Woesearchaeota archaeon]
MKRWLAFLVVFLLGAQASMVGTVAGDLSLLTDGGQTDSLDRPIVLWTSLNDGSILTVDNQGNVSVNAFNNGVLTTQWSVFLEIDANNARLDDAQELVTVAHDDGVYVVQMSTQTVYWNITTPDPVDDAVLDNEGELWLVYFAGKRRADQYDTSGFTGVSSTTIASGISAFEILHDGRVAIASYNKKIYVHNGDGSLANTLSEPNGIVSSLVELDNDTLLAGTTGGMLYHYDSNTWTAASLSLGHTKQTTSIDGYNGMYVVGAKQGKTTFVDRTNFTVLQTFTASGDVIATVPEFTGQFFAIGVGPTDTKIRYFDLDSDQDGVNDLTDAFPNDPTQTLDSDEDGYGDDPNGNQPDAFPNEPTQWADSDGDGYGDNVAGENPDLFPNNADQWADADGDGYGDNSNGQDGDVFPEEGTQWADTDRDGYGDNPEGFKPDSCPTVNAFSSLDRYGCPDSDLDGYSNPDENWTIDNGADALPSNPTQWLDGDGDGYGDAADGQSPDACPWEFGTSTKAVTPDSNSSKGYTTIPSFGCLDEDGDGYVDRTESPLMDMDPNEHFDGDGDGVGSNADYDDTRGFIQTEQDHCLNDKNDTSEACKGWNDPAYQAYVNSVEEGTIVLGYNAWNTTKDSPQGSDSTLGSVDDDTLNQVIMVGLVAFVGLTALILGAAFIINRRKEAATTKEYGGVRPGMSSEAAKEALEGRGGLSAAGGIISDASWDDDVVQLNFDEEPDGFDDMALKSDSSLDEPGSMTYEEESIEAIAGVKAEAEPATTTEAAADSPERPSEAPPLPEGGLPEGWTMDQWQWYGHEWLAKYGKN